MEFYIELPILNGNLTSNCLHHIIPFDVLKILYTPNYTFKTLLAKNFLAGGLAMIHQTLGPTIP